MIFFFFDNLDNNYRGFKIVYWVKINGKGSLVVVCLVCLCLCGLGQCFGFLSVWLFFRGEGDYEGVKFGVEGGGWVV